MHGLDRAIMEITREHRNKVAKQLLTWTRQLSAYHVQRSDVPSLRLPSSLRRELTSLLLDHDDLYEFIDRTGYGIDPNIMAQKFPSDADRLKNALSDFYESALEECPDMQDFTDDFVAMKTPDRVDPKEVKYVADAWVYNWHELLSNIVEACEQDIDDKAKQRQYEEQMKAKEKASRTKMLPSLARKFLHLAKELTKSIPLNSDNQDVDADGDAKLPDRAFAWPEKRRYNISSRDHAKAALKSLNADFDNKRINTQVYGKCYNTIMRAYRRFGMRSTCQPRIPGLNRPK